MCLLIAAAAKNRSKPHYVPQQQQQSQGSEASELKNMFQSLTGMLQKESQAREASTKMLETQIAQLAGKFTTRAPGKLPSQLDQKEETLNAITLRSGSTLAGPVTVEDEPEGVMVKKGVLENVPVQIGKFFFPVAFVVLDIPEDFNTPIILGRAFLHTAGAPKKAPVRVTVSDLELETEEDVQVWEDASDVDPPDNVVDWNVKRLSTVEGTSYSQKPWEVTEGDIRKALFSMGSHKSPGQDGFSAQFYKTNWGIIKSDFCSAIQEFFKKGTMPKQANTTLLALIPKKQVVNTVMDYRPIACCTVLYKTISKILCDRLKVVLPEITGKEQGAFVAGRSIFDNIMLTQSSVKGYGQQGVSPRCLIKVDIRKAFDSLQWTFIEQMLKHFNFPPQFQKWVMDCINSTWFSLKINSDTVGFFKGECGLRQGDPLSPFLFVMSLEILSRLLRRIHSQPQVSYHPKCGRLGLNHLIFADDLMLFVRGDVPSVKAVTQNLEGLSYAGKISLINTVIFGLEQFWCSTLLIPKGVIKLVTKFCRHFLWGTEERQRKLIMKSWSSCCKPHVEGGFNIKEISARNKCLLCKWIWAIETHADSSWVLWNHAYNIKHGSFWTMQIKSFHSESWKSILKVRDLLLEKTSGIDNARTLLSNCVAGGKLQLSLIYEQLRDHDNKISSVKTVWNRVALPKHSVLVVFAMQHKLATIVKLNHKGLHMVNRCILCKAANESHQHLFFNCQFVASIWHRLLQWMMLRGQTDSLKRELHWLAGRRTRRHLKVQWISSCFTALTYSIWEERNSRIFRDVEHTEDYIVRRVQYLVSIRLLYAFHSSYEDEILESFS
ncbi:uncharacterized protein LOC141655315 [Silene latifolia]|uniref:uncharacterized protein LOC141655315 n=1 Tax=Silene latifolia TaxID=37657 RepID=UPI003D774D7B